MGWRYFIDARFFALDAVVAGRQSFVTLDGVQRWLVFLPFAMLCFAFAERKKERTYFNAEVFTRVAAVAGLCVSASNSFFWWIRHLVVLVMLQLWSIAFGEDFFVYR